MLTQTEREFETDKTGLSQKGRNYIRCSQRHFRYFENEDGAPFIPIGLNIGFPRFATSAEEGVATMHRWLDSLAENGGNYGRIFLGHPLFDIEKTKLGQFEEDQAKSLDSIITHAWSLGIRLKLTLEHFRTIENKAQAEQFPGALSFSRPSYHVRAGGLFGDMDEFLNSQAGRQHFLRKLDWLAERYQGHPGILGWDLWNEMNAVSGEGWQQWTRDMLPELKRRFPNHLAMQTLGSFDAAWSRLPYDEIMPLESNEVAQVHRYLDMGASWAICHGPVDVMMADAVATLRRIAPGKPVLLSEGGAVEPKHVGPWNHYHRDTEGTILHDVLFAPFFAGAAGSGNPWHWHEYVDRNNLWWHFQRFSRAIEGIDPIEEQLVPCRSDTERLRIYVLQGRNVCLAWCRDANSNWQTELMDGREPDVICGETIELTLFTDSELSRHSVSFYDPWTDRFTEETQSTPGVVALPSFRRSLVVRLTRQELKENTVISNRASGATL